MAQLPCIGVLWPLTKPPFGSCAIYFHQSVVISFPTTPQTTHVPNPPTRWPPGPTFRKAKVFLSRRWKGRPARRLNSELRCYPSDGRNNAASLKRFANVRIISDTWGVQRPLTAWIFRKDHYFSSSCIVYNQQFRAPILLMVGLTYRAYST